MVGKETRRRDRMDALVTVRKLSLGWHGKRGGRAVRFEFYDKDGAYIGELGVSAATLHWQGSKRKRWAEIPTGDLEALFDDYY